MEHAGVRDQPRSRGSFVQSLGRAEYERSHVESPLADGDSPDATPGKQADANLCALFRQRLRQRPGLAATYRLEVADRLHRPWQSSSEDPAEHPLLDPQSTEYDVDDVSRSPA